MRSNVANLWRKIHPEKVDQFDRLPDEIILSIFNLVGDAVALGRCCTVSKRFHSIVPEVDSVVCHVDSLTSEEEESELALPAASDDNPRHPIASFFRTLFNPLLSRLLPLSKEMEEEEEDETVSLSSMKQILRNFGEIKRLGIKLPAGELRIEDGVLLKLKAEYGSEFERCVILSASSVTNTSGSDDDDDEDDGADLESIHEAFYSEEGLNQRVVWIINSLVAISAKHHLLQPLIAEHKTLETLVLTDADGQGFPSMEEEQLKEPCATPWSAERSGVPPLDVQLWYAPRLEMPNGVVLKGATLSAIRPSQLPILESSWAEPEGNWVLSAFEGPYGAAARMLVKERIYCVDIHAF